MRRPRVTSSISRTTSQVVTLKQILVTGVFVTVIVPLVLHARLVNQQNGTNDYINRLPKRQSKADHWKKREEEVNVAQFALKKASELKVRIDKEVNLAEKSILQFFQKEGRALKDGVMLLNNSTLLSKRLASRIQRCGVENFLSTSSSDCSLRVVFVGSAQMSGRDNLYNRTFPFVSEYLIESLVKSSGLKLEVLNHAMDNDLGREGPQTNHMCLYNLVGPPQSSRQFHNLHDPLSSAVDVIAWGYDDSMQAGRSAQFEAFIRWASTLRPALVIVNREGPHGLSRRGTTRNLVSISPGHSALIYQDQVDMNIKNAQDSNVTNVLTIPEQRHDSYKQSTTWKQRWGGKRNTFWIDLSHKYSSHMDFAMVDPLGAIWHLDHLLEFSNMAFDAEKALPLVDCGYPGHPPPCDQIPQFIHNHLISANRSIQALLSLNDTGGVLCSGKFGCRHNWYGGSRSHSLRGHLNALILVYAFRGASELLQGNKMYPPLSLPLPPPSYCSEALCTKIPRCITSYEPNLDLRLSAHLQTERFSSNTTSPTIKITKMKLPRLGGAHFANKPDFQLKDLENRFSPLGYIDRKFGYRLAQGDDKDTPTATVVFTATSMTTHSSVANKSISGSPLIICEPPCFADECPSKRIMPLIGNVTIELDDIVIVSPSMKESLTSRHYPEIGRYCSIVSDNVPVGNHTLRLTTNVVAPNFVMLSHVISF